MRSRGLRLLRVFSKHLERVVNTKHEREEEKGMMKQKRLLYMTTSFLALSLNAGAAELSVTCEQLGYTVPVADCLAVGGAPLLCPVAEGETDSAKLSLCYSASCRGYPLWKEGNVYYHLDKNGNRAVAAPASGRLEDYVKNGAAGLLSCATGSASDAKTYYRVKECAVGALYNNDICDEGCAANKYPYDTHPGDMAGTVEMCEDESGEHYGYSSCNDGWTLSNAQCLLSSCDIKEYPYMGDPNLINDENRGATKTCRIGGNAYYKYTSCKDGYELKRGVCVKRCALTSCSKTPTTVDGFTYNNWSCSIPNTCRIGDYITYGGNDIGILFHIGTGGADKSLAMALITTTKKWAHGAYETTDVTSITNITNVTAAKADFDGKIKTKKIIEFTTDYATNFPAAAYCYTHNTNCDVGSVCTTNEWYLPAEGELGYMYDNRYLLYNVTSSTTFTSNYFWSSTENYSLNAWLLIFSTGERPGWSKNGTYFVRPVLAF